MNKATYYSIVLDVYKKCNIHSFPFDCISVLEQYGYRCISYESLSDEKKCACYNTSPDAFTAKNKVYYKSTSSSERIRFSLMHELAHKLLKHTNIDEEKENEADYLASCILAPRIMIHQLCLTNKYSKVTADDIHDYFDMSISASNRALMDYHMWFSNIAHSTRKPTDVELAIKKLFIETPIPKKQNMQNQYQRSFRYLLDFSNDEYFIREMERRRTEPY